MPADPLRDDLGLELERLVAIDPSPEFGAQVRARIAGEDRAWWLPRWQMIGLGAAAAAAAAITAIALVDVAQLPPAPSAPTQQSSVASTPPTPPPAEVGLRSTTSRPVVAPRAARHRVVRRSAPTPVRVSVIPLEPLAEIAIEPVAIEPLSPLPPLSGERQ
jgi:hypothetical protein